MSGYLRFARLALVALPVSLLFAGGAGAEAEQVYGGSPFLNEWYSIDVDTAVTSSILSVTVPTRTITGIIAAAMDPTSGKTYAIVKAAAVAGRLLIIIDLATAAGVEVGNLGDNFSSLAFRSDGQLFGLTGDGATVPETMYLIDKTNATKVFARTLSNGLDGEVLAYNSNDAFFYHWSGNDIVVFERIDSAAPYAVTNIPLIGAGDAEVFGAVWDCRTNRFVVSNIDSRLQTYATDGTVGAVYGAQLVDDTRGLALPHCTDLIFEDGFEV